MFILSQNGMTLVNLASYDSLKVDEKDIYAIKGDKYVVLGSYEDENKAFLEFQSIVENLSSTDDVIVME